MSEVQRLQNVALKPLEGMEDIDIPALLSTASGGAGVSALLAMCNNWHRPNATLKGKCLLVCRSRFEVDIGYHAEVIGLFKQMSSRNYGKKPIGFGSAPGSGDAIIWDFFTDQIVLGPSDTLITNYSSPVDYYPSFPES